MNAEAEGRTAALRFREEHGLGMQPMGDLVAVIEQVTGIDVAVLEAGPDEHGMTMRDPRRSTVFIGVARTQNPMRQRSTLAHELGHVIFEDWAANDTGSFSDRTDEEKRADAFARHLLAPADGVREFLGKRASITQSVLSAVVQRFLVSPAIAAIVLQQAGYIDVGTKQDWMALSARHLAVRFGWGDHYRQLQADSDQRRAPQRLLARSIKGYAEGVLSAQVVATLRGVALKVVESELKDAGVVPVERPVTWADPTELPDAQVDLAALDEDLNAPEDQYDTETETGR